MTPKSNPWPSRLGVGRRANNSTLEKTVVTQRQQNASDLDGTPGTRPLLRNKDLRLGTWNVRTLAVPGKIDILSEELKEYNIDIAALQETKWPAFNSYFFTAKNKRIPLNLHFR